MRTTSEASHDFCSALLPAHCLERCIGLAEFKIKGTAGNRNLVLISRRSLYKLTFYTLLLAGTIGFSYLNDILRPPQVESILYVYLSVYDLHADFTLIWLMVFSSDRKLLKQTWEEVMKIDDKLAKVGCKLNNRRLRFHSASWIICSLSLILINHTKAPDIATHITIGYPNVNNVVFFFTQLYRLALVTTFTALLFSLSSRFGAVNRLLGRKHDSFPPDDLSTLRQVHQELLGLSAAVTQNYSAPIIFSFSMDYFVIIFQMYDVLRLVIDKEYSADNLLVAGIQTALFGSHTAMTILAGSVLTKQVNVVKQQLYRLSMRTNDIQLIKELNAFSLQLLHEDAKVTAGGFFAIDWSLLFKMVSAGTTYLVILIQLSDLSV